MFQLNSPQKKRNSFILFNFKFTLYTDYILDLGTLHVYAHRTANSRCSHTPFSVILHVYSWFMCSMFLCIFSTIKTIHPDFYDQLYFRSKVHCIPPYTSVTKPNIYRGGRGIAVTTIITIINKIYTNTRTFIKRLQLGVKCYAIHRCRKRLSWFHYTVRTPRHQHGRRYFSAG